MFYEDEVDIDLNPKIGADCMRKGQQKRIVTPGQNQKLWFIYQSVRGVAAYITASEHHHTGGG